MFITYIILSRSLDTLDRTSSTIDSEKTFAGLERDRERGKLRSYGVATWNGFRSAADSEEFHSLERIVQTARDVGGDSHGFGFIQLPFNLAMPEAQTMVNQTVSGENLSTLEAAAKLGITVVASASILQGRMAHGLPDEIRSTFGLASTHRLRFSSFAPLPASRPH